MSVSEDDVYMGEEVLTFGVCMMAVSQRDEPAVAFIFLFNSGSIKVAKFTSAVARAVSNEIRSSFSSLSVKDEREKLMKIADDEAYLTSHPEMKKHPFFQFYMTHQPEHPVDLGVMLSSQYVTFIHVNAYQSVFKFDMNFVDTSVVRVSMPISLVWIFVEHLERALEEMKAISKSG